MLDVTFNYSENPYKCFNGSGTLKMPSCSPIGDLGLGTQIVEGRIDSIGGWVDTYIPLGTTGLTITQLRASVYGLVWEPLKLSAGLNLSTTISWIELYDIDLTYTWHRSLSGEGHLFLFNNDVAYVGFHISKELLKFYGGVTIIPDPNYKFLFGHIEASLLKTGEIPDFTGRLTATLQIPDGQGFPYGLIRCITDLPDTIAHTDNYLTNTSIAGNFSIFSLKWHYKIFKNDSVFEADFGKGWESFSDRLCMYNRRSPSYLSLKNEILRGAGIPVTSFNEIENLHRLGERIDFEFELEDDTKTLIIKVEDENSIPNSILTLPDSTQVTPGDLCNGIEYYKNISEGQAYYICKSPLLGQWVLSLTNISDEALVEFKGATCPPIINLNSISSDRSDNFVTITWADEDMDGNAQIDLYYDNDKMGANGFPILADYSEDDFLNSFDWDISDIPSGLYYIYAVISDSSNSPFISYAPNPIKIVNNSILVNTPYDFNASIQGDTAIMLEWECDDPESLLRYVVYYDNSSESLSYNSPSYSIGSKKSHPFVNFTPGKKYFFMVTAVDDDYNESDYSNIDSVLFISEILNNAPVINNTQVADVIYLGETFEHYLDCTDPDTPNSALSYDLVCMNGSDTITDEVTISNDGIIIWNTDYDDIGYYQIKAKVTDPENLSDSISFFLSVIDPDNDNKYISINSPVYTCYGGKCFIEVNDYTLTTSADIIDNISIKVFTNADPDGATLTAVETEPKSKIFTAVAELCQVRERENQIMVDTLDTIKAIYVLNGDTLSDQCYFRHEPFTVTLQKEGDTIFCTGDSLNITLNAYSDDYTSYLWSDGETRTPSYQVADPGRYWVTVSNKRGCVQTSDSLLIVPSPSPTPFISPEDSLDVCFDSELDPGEFSLCTYCWNNGDTTRTTKVTNEGWYKVIVTNIFGCIGEDSVFVYEVDYDPVADFSYSVLNSNYFQFNDSSQYADSYIWNFGDDTPLCYNQNPSHQYEFDGIYLCTLIVKNSCTRDTITRLIDANSIDEFELSNILLYPNPTSGIIDIKLSNLNHSINVRISVVDVLGNVVWEKEQMIHANEVVFCDLSSVRNGLYVFRIQSSGWLFYRKIIINK